MFFTERKAFIFFFIVGIFIFQILTSFCAFKTGQQDYKYKINLQSVNSHHLRRTDSAKQNESRYMFQDDPFIDSENVKRKDRKSTESLTYLKISKNSRHNETVIILVLSARKHRHIRDTIRNTWAKNQSNVFFVVGKPCMYRKVDRIAWTCHPKPNVEKIRFIQDEVEDAK